MRINQSSLFRYTDSLIWDGILAAQQHPNWCPAIAAAWGLVCLLLATLTIQNVCDDQNYCYRCYLFCKQPTWSRLYVHATIGAFASHHARAIQHVPSPFLFPNDKTTIALLHSSASSIKMTNRLSHSICSLSLSVICSPVARLPTSLPTPDSPLLWTPSIALLLLAKPITPLALSTIPPLGPSPLLYLLNNQRLTSLLAATPNVDLIGVQSFWLLAWLVWQWMFLSKSWHTTCLSHLKQANISCFGGNDST